MIPFSELPLPVAAFAAVAAAVIVAIVHAGLLGRHVYEQLRLDILERTRANGWDDVPTSAPADPVPAPDSIVAAIGYDDNALEAAVAEAMAGAEVEIVRLRAEADDRLTAAVRDAQAAAAATLADMRQEAAAELARVKQEAERTLAAKVEEARKAAEQSLAQARADADRERAAELARVKQEAELTLAAKLQEARSEITAAAEARIADVRNEAEAALPPTPAPDVVPEAQNSAPTRKQTIEEHIREARAKLARQKQDFSV